MKWTVAVAARCVLAIPLVALDGQPGLHDPSTVIAEHGKYYVYATGGGLSLRLLPRRERSADHDPDRSAAGPLR